MKKIFVPLAFALTVILSSCNLNVHTVEKPEELGKHVFALLEDIGDINFDVYKSHFLTTEEYHALAEMKGVDKTVAKNLRAITEDLRNANIQKSYDKLMAKSSKEKIRWSLVEYTDFTYELEDISGLTMCYGKLFFTHKNKRFRIKVTAIKTKDGFALEELSSLKELKD